MGMFFMFFHGMENFWISHYSGGMLKSHQWIEVIKWATRSLSRSEEMKMKGTKDPGQMYQFLIHEPLSSAAYRVISHQQIQTNNMKPLPKKRSGQSNTKTSKSRR